MQQSPSDYGNLTNATIKAAERTRDVQDTSREVRFQMPAAGLGPAILPGGGFQSRCVYQFRHAGAYKENGLSPRPGSSDQLAGPFHALRFGDAAASSLGGIWGLDPPQERLLIDRACHMAAKKY